MDRVRLKENAKKKIEGNKWFLWKPLVYFTLILFAVAFVIILPCCFAMDTDSDGFKAIVSIISSLFSFLETFFIFGYAKYCLNFVRGKKEDWKEPFKFGMKYFVPILLIDLLMSLNIIIGSVLLIIPGIMAALGLSFVQEVFADNQKLGVKETLKKSWDITNGYKMDLFVLGLSFLGWSILGALTCGILYIWVFPYMTVTYLLAYEELAKKK